MLYIFVGFSRSIKNKCHLIKDKLTSNKQGIQSDKHNVDLLKIAKGNHYPNR